MILMANLELENHKNSKNVFSLNVDHHIYSYIQVSE